jgi:hypothetical protein
LNFDHCELEFGSGLTCALLSVGYSLFVAQGLDLLTEEIKGRPLLLDFFAYSFIHPAQALVNSTPQLLARDRRTVAAERAAWPGDLRMDAAALKVRSLLLLTPPDR